jgi:hypothetical protein
VAFPIANTTNPCRSAGACQPSQGWYKVALGMVVMSLPFAGSGEADRAGGDAQEPRHGTGGDGRARTGRVRPGDSTWSAATYATPG